MPAKTNAENQAAYTARQRGIGRRQRKFWITEEEHAALQAHLDRVRSGDAPAEPGAAPDDPRQIDLEEAIEGAAVPVLTEADLRKGEAELGGRIGVEAVHADWRRFVAGMDEPLRSTVGHWIYFCRKRAGESG